MLPSCQSFNIKKKNSDYSDIQIFVDTYIHLLKYSFNLRVTKTLEPSIVDFFFLHRKNVKIFKYSNTYREIYSFGKYLFDGEAPNILG